MAEMIFDEVASAPLHRWLSFLRIFMSQHPRVGAQEYAVRMGDVGNFKPGWNAVHRATGDGSVNYVWIGPNAGRTTETRPNVPEDQIHIIKEESLPQVESTSAWRQSLLLADILIEQKPQNISQELVQTCMDRILATAKKPLRGTRQEIDDRIAVALKGIGDRAARQGGGLQVFAQPVIDAVDDCLSFRITRNEASNLVAVLLAQYVMRIPSGPGFPQKAELLKEQIDHLIELTTDLGENRHGEVLGSFYRSTYLALVLAEAALLMASQTASGAPSPELRRWLEKRALYIEEYMAHELAPSLFHPMVLVPFGILESQHAALVGIEDTRSLYRGTGIASPGPVNSDEIYAYIKKHGPSSAAPAPHWNTNNSLFSRSLSEHLQMFILTMQLGASVR